MYILNFFKNNYIIGWLGLLIAFLELIIDIIKDFKKKEININIEKIKTAYQGKVICSGLHLTNNRNHQITINNITYYDIYDKKEKRIEPIIRKINIDKYKIPVTIESYEELFILFTNKQMELFKNNIKYNKVKIYLGLTSGEKIKVILSKKFIIKYFNDCIIYNDK